MKDGLNMTIQDAIQDIDGLVHAAMREYNIKDEEDAYDEKVLGIAVRAMNKQIPIKPIEEVKEFRCGNCNAHVMYRDHHCWRCGQRQDWEDYMVRVSNKDEARKAFKNWGFSEVSIDMEDIEHLKNGGWIVFNNGEYSTGVYLEGLED